MFKKASRNDARRRRSDETASSFRETSRNARKFSVGVARGVKRAEGYGSVPLPPRGGRGRGREEMEEGDRSQ